MIAEYLDHALSFDRVASETDDPEFKRLCSSKRLHTASWQMGAS
jgi:hypothetical protein